MKKSGYAKLVLPHSPLDTDLESVNKTPRWGSSSILRNSKHNTSCMKITFKFSKPNM